MQINDTKMEAQGVFQGDKGVANTLTILVVLAFGNPATLNILNEIDELKQISRLIRSIVFPFYVSWLNKSFFSRDSQQGQYWLFLKSKNFSADLISYKQEQNMLWMEVMQLIAISKRKKNGVN